MSDDFNLEMGLATRVAFGETLVELGHDDSRMVVLDADLSKSTQTHRFQKAHPDRFFNIGIAEANMASIAAGLASTGRVVYISSFAIFLIGKAFDQLRMASSYGEVPVKVVVTHGGISVGEDGPSQHAIEDIGLALSLANFDVVVPSDQHSTSALIRLYHGLDQQSVYMRLGRPVAPLTHSETTLFVRGRWNRVREGSDVAIYANGLMVAEALKAAHILSKDHAIDAEVWDAWSVRPLDHESLIESSSRCGAVVTVEEHMVSTGLGGQVAIALSESTIVPLERVGIRDVYAESGTPTDLLKTYGCDWETTVSAVLRVMERKG